MKHLSYAILESHVAEIVLNNPPQNRVDEQMGRELLDAVDAIEASDARAVILRAEGKDFSFGGDIMTWPETPPRELRAKFESFIFAFNRFEQMPLPVIAAVNGLCYGGGFELAVRADVIFAGETARFGHPEATIGIVTVLGGIYRVAERVGRARAYEWALTSEQVPAQTMASAGLVNHVVPDAELMDTTTAFAQKIASGPTRSHSAHKALLRLWENSGPKVADDAMWDIAMPLFASKDSRMALPAAVEAIKAGNPRPAMPFTGQ
ncbi:enoyl-CoA hydratase/isomerase family protein [Arthrobacter sp. NPDC080031]|uniref:enoyl-CoA hydratase/isomerase family protein n=1 Tax=Arthrobacter sp. NPDC080031 TaxID=3155918 RepID=UPI00344F5ADA